MTPEQWREVKRLFEASVELDASQRVVFLEEACAGEETRREVESLLARHDNESSFLERPALEDAARLVTQNRSELVVGQTVGRYQILSFIGAGGMGDVYRARDSKLGRDVALKVLPDEFSKDRERLIRSEREAKLLASLNHSNIAAIYDLEESGGIPCLVLEFVEGETLAERLKRAGSA